MSIDRRIGYKVVFDTETAPIVKGVIDGDKSLVYDFGYAIVDKRGKVYLTRSFVVSEIFDGEKELMSSAYYNEKIPNYIKDIENGSRVKANFYTIRNTFLADLEEYGIINLYAHNAMFDYKALNRTMRWITNDKYRYFFPKKYILHDTNKMACSVVQYTPTYRRFCENNGYLTNHKPIRRPQTKAEILYRYITQNNDFVESHTGLEDVMIEKEIMAYCYRKHKAMKSKLFKEVA